MYRPRLIPVLTLKGRGLVKTIKFNKKNCRYIGDPINAVHVFNELEADELIFLDITATLEKRCISSDLVRSIGEEAYMPFAVGGGITNLDQIHRLISSGAEKVIINTSFYKTPDFVKEAANRFGNQSIVASVDVKKNLFGKYKVYISDGTIQTDIEVENYVKVLEEAGAGEIFINSIDKDGTMNGYDLGLIKTVTSLLKIPVIACGGAGSLFDLTNVTLNAGASAAAGGSFFVYHGSRKAVLINYPEKNVIIHNIYRQLNGN